MKLISSRFQKATTDALFNLPASTTSQLWKTAGGESYFYSFEHVSSSSPKRHFLEGFTMFSGAPVPTESSECTIGGYFYTLYKSSVPWRRVNNTKFFSLNANFRILSSAYLKLVHIQLWRHGTINLNRVHLACLRSLYQNQTKKKFSIKGYSSYMWLPSIYSYALSNSTITWKLHVNLASEAFSPRRYLKFLSFVSLIEFSFMAVTYRFWTPPIWVFATSSIKNDVIRHKNAHNVIPELDWVIQFHSLAVHLPPNGITEWRAKMKTKANLSEPHSVKVKEISL